MTPSFECFPFQDGMMLVLIHGADTVPSVVNELTGERVAMQGGPGRGEFWAGSLEWDRGAKAQMPFAVEIDGATHRVTASWAKQELQPPAPPPPKRRARRARKAR